MTEEQATSIIVLLTVLNFWIGMGVTTYLLRGR